ncbi:MAG: DUF3854 domain-containing protein, partial [Salinibacter sp.]
MYEVTENGNCHLQSDHLNDLHRSGLSEETIVRAGIYSPTLPQLQKLQANWDINLNGIESAYLIPYDDEYGRLRLVPPIQAADGSTVKYVQPSGSVPRLYIPAGALDLAEEHEQLIVTEGEKKALAGVQAGLPVVALGGVWAWKRSGVEDDEQALIPDLERLPLDELRVTLLYDSDIVPQHPAWPAFGRFAAALLDRGAQEVKIATLADLLPTIEGLTVGNSDENGDKSDTDNPSTDRQPGEVDGSNPDEIREKSVASTYQASGAAAEVKGVDDLFVQVGEEQGMTLLFDLIERTSSYRKPEVRFGDALEALQTATEPSQQLDAYRDARDALAEMDVDDAELDLYIDWLRRDAPIRKDDVRRDVARVREEQRRARVEWQRKQAEAKRDERLKERAASIAQCHDILGEAAQKLHRLGLVGDAATRHGKIIFLVLTSRLLCSALKLHIYGSSSSGKSFLMRSVAQLFPDDAQFEFTASSERALIYSDRDFRHTALLIGETTGMFGMSEEGEASVGATILRSLLSEGVVRYPVTERDPQTGQQYVREIVKEGPVALVTTGTRPLPEELATRILTIVADDSPDHTREVLRSVAGRHNARADDMPDLTAWHDFQRWLQARAPFEVTIP